MDEEEDEPVPLPNVNAAILKKVIQWCTYHKDDPPPPEDDENKEKRTDDISSWDAEFLKVDQGTLFECILVSGIWKLFRSFAFVGLWLNPICTDPLKGTLCTEGGANLAPLFISAVNSDIEIKIGTHM